MAIPAPIPLLSQCISERLDQSLSVVPTDLDEPVTIAVLPNKLFGMLWLLRAAIVAVCKRCCTAHVRGSGKKLNYSQSTAAKELQAAGWIMKPLKL
jgi:hypothetical protein